MSLKSLNTLRNDENGSDKSYSGNSPNWPKSITASGMMSHHEQSEKGQVFECCSSLRLTPTENFRLFLMATKISGKFKKWYCEALK
jgi:hypothetical protein